MFELNYQVPPAGPTDALIVLIGEAPASEELNKGKPFVGSAGRYLTNILKGSGLSRDSFYITNVSKERAPKDKMANMPFDRLKAWEQDLLEEINLLPNPKILVPMGNFALKAVAGRSGITNLRGSVLPPVDEIFHDCIVIPTFHPSAIHYNYSIWPLIAFDFVKIKRIAESGVPFQFPAYKFILQPTFEETMSTLDMLEGMGDTLMTIDVETPHMLLSCIGIAWSRTEAFCLPFFWGDGRNYWTEEEEFVIWRCLSEVLPKLNLGNQNVLFDWEIMANYGIALKMPTFDPMLMHACLYSELRHKLEIITSLYTDMEFYKRDEKEEKGSALKAGDEMNHWRYNTLDCIAALWSIEELAKELIEENMMDFYLNFYGDLIEPIFMMNMKGVRLNKDDLEKSRKEMTGAAEEIDAEITRAAGHDVNINSPKQVAIMLYDEFMMQPPKIRGDEGGRPTGKEAMKKLAYKYQIDVPLKIVEARGHRKLLSLFSDENISEDGRMKCQYSLSRTTTGRFASKKKKGGLGGKGMNLQNVKNSGPARSFFVAEEGHVIVGADQKAAEARIVGWLSKDESMIALFDSGQSIHIQNAKNLFGEVITKDDPRYRIAKSLIHAGDYGIGPWGFAYAANLPFTEAKQKLALYHSTYPGIKSVFHHYVEEQIRKVGMLHNPFGRRQVFFGRLDDNTFRAGYSFIPQSTVSDINKTALKRIYKDYLPLIEAHDGLYISVPANDVQGGIDALNAAYDVTFKIWEKEYVMPIELSVGSNWRDMKEIE